MSEAAKEAFLVTLMGPPRIRKHGGTDRAHEPVPADADVLELMALLLLSLLAKHAESDPRTPVPKYYADRKRLAEHFDPNLFAQDAKRARDNLSYVLGKLNNILNIRLSPAKGPSEYNVIGVTLEHLGIDARGIMTAAHQPHSEANQDLIIARGGKRLLEGMAYPWLVRPLFQELRRSLDDSYLDALCRKIAGLLIKMETATAIRELDRANAYRSAALPLIEKGRERLRALDEPHPLALRFSEFQAQAARLLSVSDAEETAEPSAPAHNIPRRITSFVGRKAEMARLKELLSAERMITITGMGGCGKTRLALQAALEHAEDSGCETWLVELAGVADPGLVPQAIAQALSLPEPKQETYADALVHRFRTSRVLLLLDNCEHLLGGCAALAERLTQFCPDLTVLATSRQPLKIDGEHLVPLVPLRVPPADPDFWAMPDPVAALLEYEAAQLFVDRIRLNGDFIVTPLHVASIASICASLDGIPLALELAAARTHTLSLKEIDELLTDRFPFLTNGRSTAPARHKTLRAVIDWSYDLLTEREQALLCRLSVFAGGWTLEAARFVGASGDLPASSVLDVLMSLIDKSLVVADTTVSPGRFRMLETVRQYGDDQLRERGARDETRLRHWKYCFHLAEEADPHLTGPEPGPWLDTLDVEIDNLRAALSWCLSATESASERDRVDQGARLAGALGRFWTVRGHISEGRQWLAEVLRRTAESPPSTEVVVALNSAGRLASRQGNFKVAVELLESSLEMARRLQDQAGICNALNDLGIVVHGKGDYAAANAFLEECLTVARLLEDRRCIAKALHNLGTLVYDLCDYRRAWTLLEESLGIFRGIRYHEGIVHTLTNLGFVAAYQGDHAAARKLLEEGLEGHREMRDRQSMAYALIGLGINACSQGDHAAAQAFLEDGKRLALQLGDRQHTAYALNVLGFAAYCQNDFDAASSLFQEGRGLYLQIDVPRGTVASLHGLGLVACDQGDDERALSVFRDGLVLSDRVGDKLGVVNLLEGIAGATASAGSIVRAARLWGAAAALREEIDAPLPPNARERCDRRIAAARATLGDAPFDAAFTAGRSLSWEQAVAEARS